MTVKYTLEIDSENCVGCNACEVACKQVHDLPVGPRLISVRPDDCREIAGKQQLRFIATYCRHCKRPQCRDICATGAITVTDNGIVLVNEELCIGCGSCVEACPFNAMQFNNEKQLAMKCDLCQDRLAKGLQPACVSACPSRCIQFINKKKTKTAAD
ncbi:MAG: 4Fe-4S binding protein [Dehalococcoidia bacterium]